MKKFAKILSILCTLALIASCISVGFVANAAEATFTANTALTSVDNSYASVYGTNHLANSSMTYSLVGDITEWSGTNTPNFAKLTDGLTDARYMIQPSGAMMGDSKTNYTQKEEYLQLQFSFQNAYNDFQKFLFSYEATGGSLHYEIFASNSADTLYSNSLYERSVASDSSIEHIIDISALELKGIKYFAVRFYNLQLWGDCMLPYEIAVYGGESVVTTKDALSGDYSSLGANNLAGSTVVGSIPDDTLDKTADISKLTDNTSNAENHIQGKTWAGIGTVDNITQKSDYIDLKFTLPATVKGANKILASFRKDCASKHFEVFASVNEADLYNNSVYEYSSNSRVTEVYIDAEIGLAKYVAFRFYELPSASYLLLYELGIYGGKSTVTTSALTSDANGSYESEYGANRLAKSTLSYSIVEATDTTWKSDNLDPDKNILTSNSSSDHNQIQPNKQIGTDGNITQKDEYIELVFNLNSFLSNPEELMLTYRNAGEGSQHFEMFASAEESALFNSSVYEYSASSVAGWQELHVDLTSLEIKNVKYIGFRFYELNGASYLLLRELAVYGGEVEKAATITTGYQNYSKGSAYTAYGQNHLEYAIGEAIATNGTDTVAANVALGSVDGKFTDSGTIAVGDGLNINKEAVLTEANNGLDQTAAYLQLQYTLNAPVDNPQKFVFIHHNSVSGSFNSAHYAVFASDSLDTLYNKALYEFKADAGVGNTHVIDISEFELQNVKYAAIRLYHRAYNNTNQHIEEFGLYGGTMEAGFNTNSTAAFTNTSWGSNNILTGKAVSAVVDNGSSVVPFEDTDNYLAGFTNDVTADDGTGAKHIPGLEQGGSFKVTYDLGGTLNNPTTVDFQAGWGVGKPYTVYASATLEDLYNAENAIVEVAGYTGDIVYRKITTDITEKNLTGIKYIGLKVDATNNTMVHITEFAVKGGTYTEDPKEPEVSISLGASVFASTAGQNANDITYRLNVTSDSTIVDMGIISGFKVNIDADDAFQHSAVPTSEEYAEYLKTAPATAVKVSATAEQLTNENLYFHVTNSGTAGTADYSGYKLVTIAYVTVEFEGEEYTYYSNVITKSSMMISRNQARDYYNLGGEYKEIADTAFAGYDFTNASTDINKVREYVEAVS